MLVSVLILVFSTALFIFYIQVVCERILRRHFDREYFQAIVNANRLEFPAVRTAIEEFDAPMDYERVRMTLKCDFLALTYLLKNAANAKQRYSREERLLIIYFRVMLALLTVGHGLKLREQPLVLKLTGILQYFANVVGQRVNLVRFADLAASDYLMTL